MRRILIKTLAWALALLCMIPASPVLAENAQMNVMSQETYADGVKARYEDFCQNYLGILMTDEYYSAYILYDEIESSTAASTLVEFAMAVLNENLTEEKWVQHLATIIDMQETGFSESLACMADYDTLKTFKDYAVDAAEIAANAVGGSVVSSAAADLVSSLVDAGSSILGMVDGTLEQYRYIERVGRSYENNRALLETIAKYSDNENLSEAAKYMLNTLDIALDVELEQIGSVTSDTLKIVKKHVFSPELFAKLRSMPEYAADANSKALVEWAENTQKSVGSLLSQAKAIYGLGIFAGDMLFGTTDTYKRYAEIKADAEMINALRDAVNSTDTDTVEEIAKVVPLLQSICLLRMRGEYCNYSLVTEDAQLSSFFNNLFGDPEAQEAYFEGQSDWLTECWAVLSAILLDNPQLMGNTNDNINSGGLIAYDPVSGSIFYRSDICSEEEVERFNYSDYSAEEQRLGYATTTQHHYSIIRRDSDGKTEVIAKNACEEPSINVIGGWVYYLDSEYGYSSALQLDSQQFTERQYLRRMRPDGTENEVLISRVLSRVWVTQDDILAVGYEDDDRNMTSFDSASSKSQLLRFTLDGKQPLPMISEGFEYQDICVDPATDEIFVGRDVETEDWGAIPEDVSESEIMDGSGLWKVKLSVKEGGAKAQTSKLWEDRISAVTLVNGDLMAVTSEEFGDFTFRLMKINRDGGQAEVLNDNTGTLTHIAAAPDGNLYAQAGNNIVVLNKNGEYLGTIDYGQKPHVIGSTVYYRTFDDPENPIKYWEPEK